MQNISHHTTLHTGYTTSPYLFRGDKSSLDITSKSFIKCVLSHHLTQNFSTPTLEIPKSTSKMIRIGSRIVPRTREAAPIHGAQICQNIVETLDQPPPAAATCLNNPCLTNCSSSGADFNTCEAALMYQRCVPLVPEKASILSA